jgi:hypothetical protein
MKQFQCLSTIVAAISLVWCLVVGARIWTTPVRFSGVEWTMGSAGARAVERVECRSFSNISGLGIAPLVVPILVAGWATWAAWRHRMRELTVATVIFLTFCFVAGFSIGGAYVPIGLGLVAATLLGMLGRVTMRNRKTAV